MTPQERYYQKRLKERKPIFPLRKTYEEQAAEGQRLWNRPQPGRQVSVTSLLNDAWATVHDLGVRPKKAANNLRTRLRSYLSIGPDIERPVPLAKDRWRRP